MARAENISKRYWTGEAVRQRYGNRSRNWLNDRRKDPDFPKPAMRIANRDYWDDDELNAHDAKQRAALNKECAHERRSTTRGRVSLNDR